MKKFSNPYVREHPLALAFSISMIISGILVLAFPDIRDTSLTISTLPLWITLLWGFVLLAGGSLATLGLLACRPDFEGAGMALLGSSQLFALVTSIWALGFVTAILGVVLRGGLALGCLVRSRTLMKAGHK